MHEYFTLQWKMINRSLDEFGIKPLWGYLIGGMLFTGFTVYLFNVTSYAGYLYALIGISMVSMLSDTSRVLFLKQHFPRKQFLILRVLENLMVSVPFIIGLLMHREWLLAGALLLVGLLISITAINSSSSFVLPTPFYKFPFEFSIGFRKNILIIVIAAFLLAMAIIYQNPNLGLFAVALVLLTCIMFYLSGEPVYYVWIHRLSPSGFIKHKILVALGYATLLVLPFMIIFMSLYTDHVLYVLIIYVLGLLYVITALLSKYAFYPSSMNLLQGLLMAFSFWFPPLLLFLIPYFYRRCIRQLNPILS